jgi:predicted RNA binding protein YcfA (HicA-like mRNA interferase family)
VAGPAPLWTYAEVARYLRERGAVYLRTVGTHEQWRLANGHRITLPVPDGKAGRKAWEKHLTRLRWRELQIALARGPRDTGWGRHRERGT